MAGSRIAAANGVAGPGTTRRSTASGTGEAAEAGSIAIRMSADASAAGAASRGRPDSGYGRQDRPPRQDRPDRQDRPAGPRSSEPWSEVPEELEALLRAQLAQSPKGAPPARRDATPSETPGASAAPAGDAAVAAPATKRRTTRKKAEEAPDSTSAAGNAVAATADTPKRRAPRSKADAPAATGDTGSASEAGAAAAPKRRTTTAKASTSSDAPTDADGAAESATPKRRTTRKKPETA